MKRTHFLPIIFTALATVISTGHAENEKTYTFKLHQDAKKGDKVHEDFKFKQVSSQKVLVGNDVVQEQLEELTAEGSGIVEILEVSPHHKVTKMKLKVEKFVVTNGEEGSAKLQADSEVIGTLGEGKKVTFTVDGEDPAPDVTKALVMIFEMSADKEQEITDDEVCLTNQPRAVGSSWDADMKKAMESMPEDIPMEFSKDDAKGTVKFPAIKTSQGMECAQVQFEVEMKPKALKGVPPEFKLGKSGMKMSMEKLVPLDGTTPALEESQKMEFSFTGKVPTPDGKEAKLDIGGSISRSFVTKPLK